MARLRDLPDAAALRALIDGQGRLSLRVSPNARADAIQLPGEGEERVLHIRTTATPEDGKANAAVIALLAMALGLPKSALTITQGGTGRRKTVQVG